MLSQTSEYALRAMVYLAQHEADQPISGPRIAEDLGIPQKYLSAIMSDLVREGILTSSRGKGGGFGLVRAASKIQLSEVLQPFEPILHSDRSPCPFGNAVCNDDEPCGGHEHWKPIKEAYAQFLLNTSLGDVSQVDKPRGKKRVRRRK